MTVTRAKTDVVVVGLGGAGGVAVQPLTESGMEVVGLEAGTWLGPRDFAPDELRNNYRGWPQAAQKANREIPVHRPNANAPDSPRGSVHPMMNGQSMEFQHRVGDDASLWGFTTSARLDHRRLAFWV
jgi:gluconate 2-dehydrogenase alpha chain